MVNFGGYLSRNNPKVPATGGYRDYCYYRIIISSTVV